MSRLRLVLMLAVLGSLFVAGSAQAHKFKHPKLLRVGIKDRQLFISVTYDVNPGFDAKKTRALFDRDSDGVMDQAEQEKLASYLEKTAMLFFAMKVDGKEVALKRQKLSPHRLDRPAEATESLGVSLIYRVPLPAAATVEVQMVDRDKDSRRHVPLTVDLSGPWLVAFANQGEIHPAARQLTRIRLEPDHSLLLRLRRRAG